MLRRAIPLPALTDSAFPLISAQSNSADIPQTTTITTMAPTVSINTVPVVNVKYNKGKSQCMVIDKYRWGLGNLEKFLI